MLNGRNFIKLSAMNLKDGVKSHASNGSTDFLKILLLSVSERVEAFFLYISKQRMR